MKKLNLLALLVLTFITSCNQVENELQIPIDKSALNAKWVIHNSSDFDSFEFTESGKYIIKKSPIKKYINDNTIFYGTYEYIDNTTIFLSDFGVLTISDINENTINFSIQLNNSSNKDIITASKQQEMANTAKTKLLCRTWELISYEGEDVRGTENWGTVFFSTAGTYLITKSSGEITLVQWKWKDDKETQFLFSFQEEPDWNEDYSVEIYELTSSTLQIVQKIGDTPYISVLTPID